MYIATIITTSNQRQSFKVTNYCRPNSNGSLAKWSRGYFRQSFWSRVSILAMMWLPSNQGPWFSCLDSRLKAYIEYKKKIRPSIKTNSARLIVRHARLIARKSCFVLKATFSWKRLKASEYWIASVQTRYVSQNWCINSWNSTTTTTTTTVYSIIK